jgi:hypothetical protein
VRALPVAVTLMDQSRAWKGRPARSRPIATRRCMTKGSGLAWTIWAGEFGLSGPGIVQASRGAWGGVMALPTAGYGVVAAGGLRGEEDEQA